jgi:glycosyltransferase involved in cell wall biosynthesis
MNHAVSDRFLDFSRNGWRRQDGSMLDFASRQPATKSAAHSASHQPHIVVGITNQETCLALTGRLRTLREAGFQVTLVSGPGKWVDSTAASEGVAAICIPMRREIALVSDMVSLVRLWLLLRRLRPDIAEFSTPKAGLLGSVAGLLAGVPRRVYLLRGLKLETSSGFKRRVLLAAERVAARCAQIVLCTSESLRDEALALGIAPASKLHLLGEGSSNGVDTKRFSPGPSDVRKLLNLPREALVVGFVGRLTRDKGVPELVEAFDAILKAEPKAHLLLVGWFDTSEDALDNATRARIKGHPRIHRTGFVDDTTPYYRILDVMVLPTRREGFPNAVLEAAATGVPVITTDCTGSRDSVVPDVTGLLIPPGHPGAISETVLKLLRDPKLRQRMGAAARVWVLKHYARERVTGLVARFYGSLLEPASAASSFRLPRLLDDDPVRQAVDAGL